ncbi:hypothetical protein MUK70_11825 [Dyadobacter chenwenxiniae]|uniref:Uncharacterized protein n=1 Tax=Dyadobacter chenwenxiniae TaxID=2906456 RepID=A0A9X1PGR4_9BACT|nr:hypothetical protein [Dyadobacter chenwenxiniae]MCF0059930.1 hypothetical protein [Dyadobacter chenwenxiniae]UON85669.1 hypothetical protein MUK70_11825 [Dyadobacter chenwenxiniae]
MENNEQLELSKETVRLLKEAVALLEELAAANRPRKRKIEDFRVTQFILDRRASLL